MATRYTWSKGKAKLNVQRHHISFDEARNVFDDPFVLIVDDCETEEGMRYHAIGHANGQLLAVVVFLDQTEDEDIHLHIISARKAEAFEENLYADQFA